MRITGSRAAPAIAEIGLYKRPGGSSSGGASLKSAASGRCLDVNGASTTPGVQLQIWDCNGQANQQWAYTSSKQLTVYSGGSQLCLDASGQGTSNGTKVVTWTCNGGSNQQWTHG